MTSGLPLFDAVEPNSKQLSAQCRRLLDWLKSGRPITPLESWTELGIMRLAARINDLRNAGYEIESRMISVRSRWGDRARVSEYRLCR